MYCQRKGRLIRTLPSSGIKPLPSWVAEMWTFQLQCPHVGEPSCWWSLYVRPQVRFPYLGMHLISPYSSWHNRQVLPEIPWQHHGGSTHELLVITKIEILIKRIITPGSRMGSHWKKTYPFLCQLKKNYFGKLSHLWVFIFDNSVMYMVWILAQIQPE